MAQSLSLTLEIILPVVVAAEASILALLLLSGPSLILLATPLSSCRSAPVLVCDCLTESEGRTLVHDFVSAKLTSQATNLSRGALVSNLKTIKLSTSLTFISSIVRPVDTRDARERLGGHLPRPMGSSVLCSKFCI
jgi:hypothetical protein